MTNSNVKMTTYLVHTERTKEAEWRDLIYVSLFAHDSLAETVPPAALILPFFVERYSRTCLALNGSGTLR